MSIKVLQAGKLNSGNILMYRGICHQCLCRIECTEEDFIKDERGRSLAPREQVKCPTKEGVAHCPSVIIVKPVHPV